MLTPIEWWGGLLFVLGFACWRAMLQPDGAAGDAGPDDSFPWLVHLTFLAPGAVLAGYFYPLQAPALQYAYAATLALAVALLLWHAGMEVRDWRRTGPEAEPGDGMATFLGFAMLYSPLLAACVLGCIKAWPLLRPWL